MTTHKGPVFDTVQMIVDSRKNYHIFSYRHDFDELWPDGGITKKLKKWKGKKEEQTVIIVWDGMPEDPDPNTINVGSFVSPHDWALAASWIIYSDPNLKGMKLRILILKVDPSGRSFASDSLFAFQNALPWIQDYRVAGAPDDTAKDTMMAALEEDPYTLARQRQALPPEYRDMGMFVEDLSKPGRILTTYTDDDLARQHYIELTKNLWIQNLLKAGNRHSVANLVAPTVLADGLPTFVRDDALEKISEGSLLRRALISTLKEVGFLKTSGPGSSAASTGLLGQMSSDGNVFWTAR